MKLTESQSAALKHIEDHARSVRTVGQAELRNVLTMSNISETDFERALQQIREHARVGMQFHPDRISRGGRTVARALLQDGSYKNQFETHLSSGKLDLGAEGERAHWEDTLFGGAFASNNARLGERPKYGALDIMRYPDGPCPRFGSCWFLLNSQTSNRCTFSYMDSHRNPHEKGTLRVFEPIIAALMTECFERRFALGRHNVSPTELIDHLLTLLRLPHVNPAEEQPGRNLNHYIEAQVHGDISLERDVDVLIADPSYEGSPIHVTFEQLCKRYGIDLRWHCGFRLPPKAVPDDFRGPSMPSLAERVSTGDYIDARMIGNAAAELKEDPSSWAERGSYDVVLHELKCLWHVLVQYGKPARS